MKLSPVITKTKLEILDDSVKTFYTQVGDTFQLDLDESTLSEHNIIKGNGSKHEAEINEWKSKATELQSKLDSDLSLLTEYRTTSNKRIVNDVKNNLTKDLDLSEGRGDLLDKLLENKITSILQTDNDLDPNKVNSELSAEIRALRKISEATFVPKKDDSGGIKYEKQKGTITTPEETYNKSDGNTDEINYDMYEGNLSSIDYNHFMKTYFEKEDN